MYNKMKEVIPLFKVFMSEDVIKPVNEVLLSGFIGQGTKVDEFENLLKNKFNVDNLITINRKSHNLYECYVKVNSKYTDLWTNDYIEVNKWGTIIKSDVFYKMKSHDNNFSDKVKQYNRDKALEQIGI